MFLIIACGYNLAKEVFQMFDEVSFSILEKSKFFLVKRREYIGEIQ